MRVSRRQFLAAALGGATLLGGCARPAGQASATSLCKTFFCFDTPCEIGGVMEQALLDSLADRCAGFERTLSRTIAGSDVGRINAAGGEPVEVEAETAELIDRSLAYGRASHGLFDVTIGSITMLWNFKEGVVPTDAQVADALPHVDYRKLRVEGRTVRLEDPQAKIDLGGIAKGYVADVLVDTMRDAGVASAYVNLGGDVRVLGKKPDGSPWRVGVREPGTGEGEERSLARVELDGGSMVTSGLYERQFERDGKQYWHILDPRTGYPAQGEIVSATIVSEHAIDGEGYTKPLFMMGVEDGLAWLAEQGELACLCVGKDDSIHMQPEGSFELL